MKTVIVAIVAVVATIIMTSVVCWIIAKEMLDKKENEHQAVVEEALINILDTKKSLMDLKDRITNDQ